MNLQTRAMEREFYFNGVRIPDPGPDLSVDQVRDLLAPRFPEIATAEVQGPEDVGNALRFKFTRAIGEKG